jgi:hypothetical protein
MPSQEGSKKKAASQQDRKEVVQTVAPSKAPQIVSVKATPANDASYQ